MKFKEFVLISTLCCTVWFCKSPFDTDASSDNLFTLTAEFDDRQRIIDTLTVKLSWSEITIDNFKEIKITRLNEHRDPDSYPVGSTSNGWVTIATINNEFTTSWIDTVRDDAIFHYRIDFYNADNNYRRAEVTITISPTTHLTIPDDYIDVKTAVESYIIDDGDSVLLMPGEYNTFAFSFLDKSIHLIGLNGARQTQLIFQHTYTESNKIIHDSTFVRMMGGTIKGLTIKGGEAYYGAGVYASGNSTLQQCIIKNNKAGILSNGGLGGGLYLTGNSSISNCIISNNNADDLGRGIYVAHTASSVNITNCTFWDNNLFSESPDVSIENSIFNAVYSGIDIHSNPLPTVRYSYAGTYWNMQNTTNISGELLLGEYFHLLPGSVCIDTGNPDPVFNDPDDSRNDIGAFGGPLGSWD
ncbi:right-handed parallel beta-helix repeat-containing protein [bacterium]|nr:right-handed parallel beta-helix repeat-containing protein [bacterium]